MSLIHSLIAIFSITLIGIIFEKRKIFNPNQIEGFEIFLIKIALPCYLFNSTFNNDLTNLINTKYIFSYILSFCVVGSIVIYLNYKNDTASSICIKILGSAYINAAIYSLPVITYLLHNPIAAIIGNLLQVIIIQPIFVIILSIISNNEKSIFKKLLASISNPIITMPVIGLTLNYNNISVHPVIINIIQSLGNGAFNIALFAFGLTLGSVEFSKINFDRNLLQSIGIKNIIHPLIAFIIGKYAFHLEKYWLYSLIIMSSAPTAYITYIIAKQFSTESELLKNTIATSSILSLISLIFIGMFLG